MFVENSNNNRTKPGSIFDELSQEGDIAKTKIRSGDREMRLTVRRGPSSEGSTLFEVIDRDVVGNLPPKPPLGKMISLPGACRMALVY